MRAVQNLFTDTPHRPRYKTTPAVEIPSRPTFTSDVPPFRKKAPDETNQEFVAALIKHVREHKGGA